MQNSDGEKDIGVLVDDQLNYSQHIQQKINKANSIMGLIRRTSITKENGYLELPKSPNFTEITVFLPKSPSDLLKFLSE
jgi:hypothetical protein